MIVNVDNSDDRRPRRVYIRFGLRTLLLLIAIASLVLFAFVRFVAPIVAHRWAIHTIVASGGEVDFRDHYEARGRAGPGSDQYPWRQVLVVNAISDQQAINVARQLKRLPEVESVCLSGFVTDEGLVAICRIGFHPSLESLNLLESPVTNSGLSHLADFKQLRTLLLNTCPIDNAGLVHLKSVPSLRRLMLVEEGNQAKPDRFGEPGFAEIGQLGGLDMLHLVRLHISDASARHLHKLSGLKRLQITRCQISDDAVMELRAALPECDVGHLDAALPEK